MAPVVKRKSGEEAGRAAGYKLGWDHGYWFGLCEEAISRIPQVNKVWPIHVMYVETGKGFPYSPIDEAVRGTLTTMVQRLTVVNSSQPVVEMALADRPDVVIVLDGLQFDVGQIIALRDNGIRTAIWLTDDPYYMDITTTIVPHYDTIFTLERNSVEYYKQLGCQNVHYLPFCFDPAQYRPTNPERSSRKEITFIGSAYLNRVSYFNELTPYLAGKNTLISGIWWDRLAQFDKLRSKIKLNNWMGPADTALAYNASKIVINMHRAHDDALYNSNRVGLTAVSPNPRTFEIAACAVLQVCDIRDDLATFFTPGVEIVTYSSPAELIEKMEYYLKHEEERQQIALRGMYRAFRDHKYANRLQTMLTILFPLL
ncbi:CgeB family protein [Paenibacillus sp. MMO-177]|uniref:CgeB family protein n=1 Tax=Paenibacillus sp. MMO-177 TaxID=3081289 RepID=UPI003015ABF3